MTTNDQDRMESTRYIRAGGPAVDVQLPNTRNVLSAPFYPSDPEFPAHGMRGTFSRSPPYVKADCLAHRRRLPTA